jgi:hypothetical protein
VVAGRVEERGGQFDFEGSVRSTRSTSGAAAMGWFLEKLGGGLLEFGRVWIR